MCGIAGTFTRRPADPVVLAAMAATIAHRGPDDQGIWADPDVGVGLAHRRLAIVDLSVTGHQPMASRDERYVLCFNGEIYNHREIRVELDSQGESGRWKGHSDTETLLEAFARWGIQDTLSRCVGMFALALWDRRDRTLYLARDRFGEKPLYYGWVGGDFVFASELKAVRAVPGFDNSIDPDAVALLAAHAYIPAPHTIYENLFKLLPGHILALDTKTLPVCRSVAPEAGVSRDGLKLWPYWSYAQVLAAADGDQFDDEEEALVRLEEALAASIGGQALADVPVGAFLSGGIDSSLVVALYRKYATGRIRTFSIGFEEVGFNEAEYAKQVANHLGTEHHERYVTVREAQDVIPRLPAMFDEPLGDSSQIPTHIVSAFARETVTVALSGDGGDELFGGYNRHVTVPRLWSRINQLPGAARGMVSATLGRMPSRIWSSGGRLLLGHRGTTLGPKVGKAVGLIGSARDYQDAYGSFLDQWHGLPSPVRGAEQRTMTLPPPLSGTRGPAEWSMYCDAMTYLPDDIMCKVDRASMAVSLETRAPFLDHRVAAVAARIPMDWKIGPGGGKLILKKLLYRQAPRRLFDRPKAGFGVPVGAWVRGPLRGWAEDLLAPDRLRVEGIFDPIAVGQRWQEHVSGRRDWIQTLWPILMFQAWREDQG
jgi:asparagine synthase (glutamine-hydrolysing)